MKKTFNINLAGFPFIIDDDAYNLLNDYLETIKSAFSKTEDASIAEDIETRIAELLLELDPDHKRIVSLLDVSKVIKRIGQPEQILEIDETVVVEQVSTEESEKISQDKESLTPPPYNPLSKKKFNLNFNFKKKLFRDPQNAFLGGVCSGIAHYFNIDATWVRVLTIILFILSASTVAIAYIILWIIVPEARTPMQRMEMKGEEPTVENIGKKITEDYITPDTLEDAEETSSKNTFGGFLLHILSIFLKLLTIFGLVIGVFVLFCLLLGLFGCIIALCIIGSGLIYSHKTEGVSNVIPFWLDNSEFIPLYGIICGIGGIITVGVPLYLLVRKGWSGRKKLPDTSAGNRRALLITWIIGIIILILSIIKLCRINDVMMIHWDNNEDVTPELVYSETETDTIYDKESLKEEIIEKVKETVIPLVDDNYIEEKKIGKEQPRDSVNTDSNIISADTVSNR